MESIKVLCRGKVNLALNVLSRENDGMHIIDSIMQTISLGDVVTAKLNNSGRISISFNNHINLGKNNTVAKTANAVRDRIGSFGADIFVEKHLPVASGLGGSSSDIAATLVALDRLLCLKDKGVDITALGKTLGSDVPFMLFGGCARVQGRGEIITPLENNLPLNMIIVAKKGLTACCSRDVYMQFDKLFPSASASDIELTIDLLKKGDDLAVKLFGNMLTVAADIVSCGEITKTASLLPSYLTPTMSGSGCSVAGFYSQVQDPLSVTKNINSENYHVFRAESQNSSIKILD